MLRAAAGMLTAAIKTRAVDVNGRRVNVRVLGRVRAGQPTIVFESGLGSKLAAWGSLQGTVARFAHTVAYERGGIGRSQAAASPRTPAQLADELRALLRTLRVPAPFLLVGHSYGGVLIHLFAATYPKAIAGLVYVDPTDFMQTTRDRDAAYAAAGAVNGRAEFEPMRQRSLDSMTKHVQAEAREIYRAEDADWDGVREAVLPSVSLAILLAGRIDAPKLPKGEAFPGEFAKFAAATVKQRVAHFGELANASPDGLLVLASKHKHFLHRSEPDLVTGAIRRVLASRSARRGRRR